MTITVFGREADSDRGRRLIIDCRQDAARLMQDQLQGGWVYFSLGEAGRDLSDAVEPARPLAMQNRRSLELPRPGYG